MARKKRKKGKSKRTHAVETAPTFDANTATMGGFNTKRQQREKEKQYRLRTTLPTAPYTPPSGRGRGPDLTRLVIGLIGMIYYAYTEVHWTHPNFGTTENNFLLSSNFDFPRFWTEFRLGTMTAIVTHVVQTALPWRVWNYKTIYRAAKRWRVSFIAGQCCIATAMALTGTSPRDGHTPWNKIFSPAVKPIMEKANDTLFGGGTWLDLLNAYNKQCRKQNKAHLQVKSRSTMWMWAGRLGWSIHRRWIKPMLKDHHKA